MYIIACRAHFCHLPGLGQVGHSPRGTSGSTGTLDWGPMWSGSQFTCHPNAPTSLLAPNDPWWPSEPLHPYQPLTPPTSHASPWHWPQAPYTTATPMPPNPYTPWYPCALYTPCKLLTSPTPLPSPDAPIPLHPCPFNDSWHPYSPCWPQCPLSLLHPYQCPDIPYIPAGFPNTPYTPFQPLSSLHPCNSQCPLKPLYPMISLRPNTPELFTSPACPLTPPIPEQKCSCQEWYLCRWAWHVISLWVRLLFCHMYLICYCLQFSIDHLHVTLVIMIQLGSIFQIASVHHMCDRNGSTRKSFICCIKWWIYSTWRNNTSWFASWNRDENIQCATWQCNMAHRQW